MTIKGLDRNIYLNFSFFFFLFTNTWIYNRTFYICVIMPNEHQMQGIYLYIFIRSPAISSCGASNCSRLTFLLYSMRKY